MLRVRVLAPIPSHGLRPGQVVVIDTPTAATWLGQGRAEDADAPATATNERRERAVRRPATHR